MLRRVKGTYLDLIYFYRPTKSNLELVTRDGALRQLIWTGEVEEICLHFGIRWKDSIQRMQRERRPFDWELRV